MNQNEDIRMDPILATLSLLLNLHLTRYLTLTHFVFAEFWHTLTTGLVIFGPYLNLCSHIYMVYFEICFDILVWGVMLCVSMLWPLVYVDHHAMVGFICVWIVRFFYQACPKGELCFCIGSGTNCFHFCSIKVEKCAEWTFLLDHFFWGLIGVFCIVLDYEKSTFIY